MRFSTTTALLSEASDDPRLVPAVTAVERLYEHGFVVQDFNFAFHQWEDYILAGDDWERRIDEVAETAARLGVEFSQSHIPFCKVSPAHDPYFTDDGKLAYFRESIRRAYIASGMLGVKNATIHPLPDPQTGSREESIRINHEFYDDFIEEGLRRGVGTAYENLFAPFDRRIVIRFGDRPDDLIALVDSYNDERIGICWDFGHANLVRLDQPACLRAIGGSRLKNLHIDDNNGTNRDEHLLPFLGTVDWQRVIPVLAEIGYQGDLTLETGQMTRKAIRAVQDIYIDTSAAIAGYLVQLYDEAAARLRGEER